MVGTTLVELRDHIEALASADGEYYVVCGRTGDRPVPISGLRFAERATARNAARAGEQYRTALRRYDPQVPYYDLIVCQNAGRAHSAQRAQERTQEAYPQTLSEPVLDKVATNPEHRRLVEFCHSVAAAVFETLSEDGYTAAETAVMDAYFDLAEAVADSDNLCLCLLESMAQELDQRLSPPEQAEVLAEAATRLTPTDPSDRPVSMTLSVLEERGLLGSYTQSPWSVDFDGGTRSVVVRLSEYALAPRNGRLPVLPIVLELYRHQPDWLPSSLRAVDGDDGWRITLVMAREAESRGLVSAPISPEV
jgi:hypothetical protein